MSDIEEKPEIRLDLVHARYIRRGIVVTLTWTLSDRRPAMVLTPQFGDDFMPCVLPLDSAFKWTDTIVGDPIHQERTAGIFAAYLGWDPMDHGRRRAIITVIQDHLQDLLTMPPLIETGEVAAKADIKMTNLETGKVTEIEATTDV